MCVELCFFADSLLDAPLPPPSRGRLLVFSEAFQRHRRIACRNTPLNIYPDTLSPSPTNQTWYKSLVSTILLVPIFSFHSGCHEDDLEAFGIGKEGWTAAAKEGEGIPWHQGVLRGAEKFMTSWHEKQEGESRKRAFDLDEKEQQGNKETTTKPGGGEAERGTGGCC